MLSLRTFMLVAAYGLSISASGAADTEGAQVRDAVIKTDQGARSISAAAGTQK